MREIDQHELAEWAAFEAVTGPIGDARLDILFAHLIRYTVMAQADPKKIKDITLDKFLPVWDPEAEPVTSTREYSEEQVAKDQAFFSGLAKSM